MALFADVKFYIAGEIDDTVRSMLLDGGGKQIMYMSDVITHVICDDPNDGDLLDAKEIFQLSAATSMWVLYSMKCAKLLPVEAFVPDADHLLKDIVVFPSKLCAEDAQQIWAAVTFYGGKCIGQFTKEVSHIICGQASGKAYEAAIARSDVHVVTPDWLMHTLMAKRLVNVRGYHPSLLFIPPPPAPPVPPIREFTPPPPKVATPPPRPPEPISQSLPVHREGQGPSVSTNQRFYLPRGHAPFDFQNNGSMHVQPVHQKNMALHPGGMKLVHPNSQAATPNNLSASMAQAGLQISTSRSMIPVRSVSNPMVSMQVRNDVMNAHHQIQQNLPQSSWQQQHQPRIQPMHLRQMPPAMLQQMQARHMIPQQHMGLQMQLGQQQQMHQIMQISTGQSQMHLNAQHTINPGPQSSMNQALTMHQGVPMQQQQQQAAIGQPSPVHQMNQGQMIVRQIPPNHLQIATSQIHHGSLPPQDPMYVTAASLSQQHIMNSQRQSPVAIAQPTMSGNQQQSPGSLHLLQNRLPEQSSHQPLPPMSGTLADHADESSRTKEALARMVNNRLQASNRICLDVANAAHPPDVRMPSPMTSPGRGRNSPRMPRPEPRSPPRQTPRASTAIPTSVNRMSSVRQALSQQLHMQAVSRAPSQSDLPSYHGHDPEDKVPPELCLLGCVFHIIDYQLQLTADELKSWCRATVANGGIIEEDYCEKVTHVLCMYQNSETCKRGLQDGKRLVTAYWLNDVLLKKKMLPPWEAMHLPSPFKKKPAGNQYICITNFEGIQRERVKALIRSIGAVYTGYLTHASSALVCRRHEGLKFQKAVEWRLPIVNVAWLSDLSVGCLDAFKLPLNPKYKRITEGNTFHFDPVKVFPLLDGWRLPLKITKETWNELSKEQLARISVGKQLRSLHVADNRVISEQQNGGQHGDRFKQKQEQTEGLTKNTGISSKPDDEQSNNTNVKTFAESNKENSLVKQEGGEEEPVTKAYKSQDDTTEISSHDKCCRETSQLGLMNDSSDSMQTPTGSHETGSQNLAGIKTEIIEEHEKPTVGGDNNSHVATKNTACYAVEERNLKDSVEEMCEVSCAEKNISSEREIKVEVLEGESEKVVSCNAEVVNDKISNVSVPMKNIHIVDGNKVEDNACKASDGASVTVKREASDCAENNQLTSHNIEPRMEKQPECKDIVMVAAVASQSNREGDLQEIKSESNCQENKENFDLSNKEFDGSLHNINSSKDGFKNITHLLENHLLNADGPPAKKTRLDDGLKNQSEISETKSHHPVIVITGLGKDKDSYISKIEELNGVITKSPTKATHLITKNISRTVKFLCAISTVKYFLHVKWVDESFVAKKFIDESNYLLSDADGEKHYDVRLAESLNRSRESLLMSGLKFYMTPSVYPDRLTMNDIITAAGGNVLRKMPSTRTVSLEKQPDGRPSLIIISCQKDLFLCRDLLIRNLPVYSAEFVLQGQLRQSLDYNQYQLGK